MRVLALTNLFPNPYQPHRAAFNRQQFCALASQHEVRVIAPIAWTTEWTTKRRHQTSVSLPESRRCILGGMIVHHPRYAFTPKILRGCYGRFFLESVRRDFNHVVDQFRPDVVLGCWAYPDGWAAVRLARQAGLPVAIKVQGSDLLTIDDQPARWRRTSEAIAAADAVIAVSQHLAAKAVAMGAEADRTHVVYNGVDAGIFNPGSKIDSRVALGITSGDPLIVFAGNLVPVKGLDTLVAALGQVARSGTSFQCVLVGEGPLKDTLLRQVETLNLSERMRLVGSRPLAELAQWYRAADLVVLPSRSEGVPNVLLEAAACGTPFIASRVGGIPEIAHPSSLFESGDVNGLATRMNDYLTGRIPLPFHPTFRAHTWAKSAEGIAQVLQRITEASSRSVARAG